MCYRERCFIEDEYSKYSTLGIHRIYFFENKFNDKKQHLRYFIELSYNGASFHGWQIQPNANSVQETIEKALSLILRTSISIVGAGRTDAGVHAKFMTAHFDTEVIFVPKDLTHKLNSLLKEPIAIYKIYVVQSEAHARFDAHRRAYEYRVITRKNPFENSYAYLVNQSLDVVKMNEAAALLLKYKNFKCFSKSNTDVKTYNCDLFRSEWILEENHLLVFHIAANRFLRNMVRAVVGTLLEVGLGKLDIKDIDRILQSEDRGEAGYSVPAKGLYLTEVVYPESVFLK